MKYLGNKNWEIQSDRPGTEKPGFFSKSREAAKILIETRFLGLGACRFRNLSFREFMRREPLQLATIQAAVFDFLRDRDDVVVFGTQAVNAYVDKPRITQDFDLMSVFAEELAQELCKHLSQLFYTTIRMRKVKKGQGYLIYQVQNLGNRYLVDITKVMELPEAQRIKQVLIIGLEELVASKWISYYQWRGQPESWTDWQDVEMILLAFPELKHESSRVLNCLISAGATKKILELWGEVMGIKIELEEDEDYYFDDYI
jgi:hypothetical protein